MAADARQAAAAGATIAPVRMRFACNHCGLGFTAIPPSVHLAGLHLQHMETGQVYPIPLKDGIVFLQCPGCGNKIPALNQHVVDNGKGGELIGFADTPEELAVLQAAVEAIHGLPEDASIDEVLETLERHGPLLQPVVDYLRQHHLELGFGLVTTVIAMLAWLFPVTGGDTAPQPPTGISERDLERLIREVRASAPAPTTQGDEQRRPGHSQPHGDAPEHHSRDRTP